MKSVLNRVCAVALAIVAVVLLMAVILAMPCYPCGFAVGAIHATFTDQPPIAPTGAIGESSPQCAGPFKLWNRWIDGYYDGYDWMEYGDSWDAPPV